MDASAYLDNLNITPRITGAAVFCDLTRPIGSAGARRCSPESVRENHAARYRYRRPRPGARSETRPKLARRAGRAARRRLFGPTLAQMMAAEEIASAAAGMPACGNSWQHQWRPA